MLNVKFLVIAAVLLLGVTGVAVAAGQVPGSISDGIAGLNSSGGPGSPGLDTGSGVANQYGPDNEADDDASDDQYGEDDEAEADDMDNDADEADEIDGSDDDYESAQQVNGTNSAPPVNTQAPGADSDERGNDRGQAGSGSVTDTNNAGANSGAAARAGSSSGHEYED